MGTGCAGPEWVTHGSVYVDLGQNYYEERYRNRMIQNMKRTARELGYLLVPLGEDYQALSTEYIPLSNKLLERLPSPLQLV